MRILVYGAGPLGSLYAARLCRAGHAVALLARGQRHADVRARGVVLEDAFTGRRTATPVPAVDALGPADRYDLVVVLMRKNQTAAILPSLAAHRGTPNVLFMANTAAGPAEWVGVLGRSRVLLGFPGAGGTLRDGVVRYDITSRWVQPTTIGEVDGRTTPRLRQIGAAFRQAGFPVAFERRMDAWLKTHVALVAPMAYALYAAGGDNRRLARTPVALMLLARAIREGFAVLRVVGVPITPIRLRLLEVVPEWLLVSILRRALAGRWAAVFLASHANAIRDEMRHLAGEFGALVRASGLSTPALDALAGYLDPAVPLLPEGVQPNRPCATTGASSRPRRWRSQPRTMPNKNKKEETYRCHAPAGV